MPDWHDPTYLLRGTERQHRAYAALRTLRLWSTLCRYHPVLAGTVPLGIDLPESDLDIVCEVPQVAQAAFVQLVRASYGHWPGFRLWCGLVRGRPSVVAGFRAAGESIELFGQALPTRQQHAYLHLLAEHAVLTAGGEPWRQAVLALKRQGLKTEPAFAQLLCLPPGDPYLALLALAEAMPTELAAWLPRLP